MGEVGKFFFGGSTEEQSGQNWYANQAQNSSQSSNNSAQASANAANSFQRAGNQSYNQAYAPMSAAMSPALGYVTQAGDMMAALLGLPPSEFSYQPTNFTPAASPLPPGETAPRPRLPNLGSLVEGLSGSLPATPSPTPPATPSPTPNPSPVPSPGPSPMPNPPTGPSSGGGSDIIREPIRIQFRELGGPVKAGQPYVVGEKRPELFVPKQDGTILPDTKMSTSFTSPRRPLPGDVKTPLPAPPTTPATTAAPTPTTVSTMVNPNINAPSALNNWADSAGMNFVLEQGQKAISGTQAANGVFNSGATGAALLQMGQNIGKTYLNDYMGNLLRYGQLGLGAGSALTGAGGVTQGQSVGGSSSLGTSAGVSSGSSTSQGTSTGAGGGVTSGSGSSKKGLVPAILG